jgi:hypothetical protein
MGLTTAFYTVDGEIIGESSSGTRFDYLTDALGSVTAKADQTATVNSNASYKPYGDKLSGTDYTFGWVGSYGYRKAVNGSYVRARHYNFNGTRSSADLYWPRERTYTYTNGNPSTQDDPSGLHCKMKESDLKIKVYDEDCISICSPLTTIPCEICRNEQKTEMTLLVAIKGCTDCKVFQWISVDGGTFRRDDSRGWPYPWEHCDGNPIFQCNTVDSPTERGYFSPCSLNNSKEKNFITCVYCSGFSSCFQ